MASTTILCKIGLDEKQYALNDQPRLFIGHTLFLWLCPEMIGHCLCPYKWTNQWPPLLYDNVVAYPYCGMFFLFLMYKQTKFVVLLLLQNDKFYPYPLGVQNIILYINSKTIKIVSLHLFCDKRTEDLISFVKSDRNGVINNFFCDNVDLLGGFCTLCS